MGEYTKLGIWFRDMIKIIPSNKMLVFDIIYSVVSIILGIIGWWTYTAAICVYFIQMMIYFLLGFLNFKGFKLYEKYIYVGVAVLFFGMHFFAVWRYMYIFFNQYLITGSYFLLLYLTVIFYREYKTLQKDNEIIKSGYKGSPFFFRYLVFWLMILFSYFGQRQDTLTLLIIFIIISFFAQQLYEADKRLPADYTFKK